MKEKTNEIAAWMFEELRVVGMLYQDAVVAYIQSNYGDEYLYKNENGNVSIDKDVKKAFKKLHGGKAAWDRDAFFWGWTSAIKG